MTNVAANPLTENQRNRRQRILQAARELVAECGYDGMIVREVAVRANVSPTTVYNLYNTKSELLLAALHERMDSAWDLPLRGYHGPGVAYLMERLHRSANQTREAPEYANAVTDALLRSGDDDPLLDTLAIALQQDLARILKTMIEDGELRQQTDVQALSTSMIGMFWSLHMLFRQQLIDVDELERQLQMSYLAALLPVSKGKCKSEIQARHAQLTNKLEGSMDL